MKIQSCLFLASFILLANVSRAQNSILAGKILDENKNPIPDAIVSVSGKSPKIDKEVRSDLNGLYNISPLPAGEYKVTIVDKKGKHVVKKLALDEAGDYHNFILEGKKVAVFRTKEDPFLKPKLMGVLQKQKGMDLPVSKHGWIRTDSNGKVKEVYYGEHVPQSNMR